MLNARRVRVEIGGDAMRQRLVIHKPRRLSWSLP